MSGSELGDISAVLLEDEVLRLLLLEKTLLQEHRNMGATERGNPGYKV